MSIQFMQYIKCGMSKCHMIQRHIFKKEILKTENVKLILSYHQMKKNNGNGLLSYVKPSNVLFEKCQIIFVIYVM